MLVLTRHAGEVIVIRDDIRVTVIGIEGGQVRLGIEAPDDVEIWRQEIWDRKQNGQEDDDGNR